jgi:hypothetical protein
MANPSVRTRADLVQRALEILLAVETGQAPAPEDQELADRAVDSCLASLSARGIFSVTDANDIPLAAFEHLAVMLADTLKLDFNVPDVDAPRAVYNLQQLNAAEPTRAVLAVDYF